MTPPTLISVISLVSLLSGLFLFAINLFLMLTFHPIDGNQMVTGIFLLLLGILLGRISSAPSPVPPAPSPRAANP